MTGAGTTSAEIARLVRLRRLVVWRLEYEQWQLALQYAAERRGSYELVEWRGARAVRAGDYLYLQGR